MPVVSDVLSTLEIVAPKRYAFSFDKVGLQVGSPEQPVTKAVVSLDRSLGAVKFAIDNGAQLLLCHHPLIFNPMTSVDTRSHQGRTVIKLIQNGISFIAAHTNWDSANGGVNDVLAEMFDLRSIKPFGSAAEVQQVKLVVSCPPDSVERILDAASEAGAGVIGAYSRCAFVSCGKGTFQGAETSHPAVGVTGHQETVDEARIEMIVNSDRVSAASRAVRKSHPYEEPVIDLYALQPNRELPAGRIGVLPAPISLSSMSDVVDNALAARTWTWGDPYKTIKRVAVVGGAGDSDWIDAQRAGADLLITGEVKQHIAVEASESGMTLIAAGHYQTEQPGCARLNERMANLLPEIEWLLYVPDSGLSGRPF
ncbi:MAG: Nif3-like dinuclear metal center hexameric protein [Fimbriimonas sp.]|nr:Nif3-like dinuclear metal center hexameric protein [Fimbriimonas sp.]